MVPELGDEPSLEQLVHEIRRIRIKRFFSLSERDIVELDSKHESVLPFLYEIYRRYWGMMDEKLKAAVAIYLLIEGADFSRIYESLDENAKNREEVRKSFSNSAGTARCN